MTNPQHEPTMEEILASIRKIISEDQPDAAKPAPQPEPAPAPVYSAPAAHAEPDVLELTEEVKDAEPQAPIFTPQPIDTDDLVFETVEEKPRAKEPVMDHDDLISDSTRHAVGRAFASLDSGAVEYTSPGSATLEAIFVRAVQNSFTPTLQGWVDGHTDEIMEGLKPLIRAWMDKHLPPLIEAAVHKEIGRAASARKR